MPAESLSAAIEAMFPSTPATPPPTAPPSDTPPPPADAIAPPGSAEATAPAPEVTPPTVEPKKSASDYAIELARERRRATKAAEKIQADIPSKEKLERLAALEASKDDPVAALKLLGIDYKTLTDKYMLAVDDDPAAHDPVAQKLAAVEAKIAQYEAEAETARKQSIISKHMSDVAAAVKAAPEAEYLQAQGKIGLQFVDLLVRTELQETGKLLPYQEAVKLAEAHFEQQAEAAAKTKKFRSKFGTQNIEQPPTSISAAHSSRASHVEKPREKKSAEDRLNDALNEFFGP